jgi:protein tyrosine phosphatase (PTP) superfamily phosphohydrolase (DUF442 family)
MRRAAYSIASILAVAGLISCSSSTKTQTVAQCDLNSPAPQALPKDTHGVHNLHALGGKIISGSVPEGDIGFDELKALGVKTIISVDGAAPDVARAKARGIRYAHIPVTYAEVTEEQRLHIARAIQDLPGPIYVHCHHGKHRAPAAVAAAAVALGIATPEQAVAYMKDAGTAPNYTGLYACVAEATAASALALSTASSDYPELSRPRGIVAAMVEVDQAYEHLGDIRSAGWATPGEQPDLVPAAEAGRLADNLRFALDDPNAASAHGKDFTKRLRDAIEKASALEDGIVRGAPKSELEGHWKLVVASCKDCHAEHRDKRK